MQNMLFFFLLLFFMDSVCGAEPVSVMEGDSVTLPTNLTDIRNDDTILWLFGPKDSVISQITRKRDLNSIYFTDDVRFRGRLQMDQNTGSLTIRNTRIRHSGQYKLSISREKTTIKIFDVTVFGVVGKTDKVKLMSVKEGESVTLKTDVEVKRDDLIVWSFGDEGILLATIDVETNESSLNKADKRFRDRLKLDPQTRSLTITNTRTEHSGLYELQIRGRESSQRFLLSVSDPGLSSGGIAGIVVAFLLVLVVVVVVIYYRHRISKLKEQGEFENKKVEEGEDLCLTTGVPALHKDDKIQWYYADENNLIAKTNEEPSKYDDAANGRFRSKLELNKTGDLTITDIRTIHSGLYILKISSGSRTKYEPRTKRFIVTLTAKTKPVAEGEVTLETGVEIQPGVLILWTFGLKNCLVATAELRTADSSRPTLSITKRFKNILKLDEETGSLTITNNKNTEYGHYKLQIIKNEQTTFRRFIVLAPAKAKPMAKGKNVTLEPGVEIQTDNLILWMFGAKNCLIARADSRTADSRKANPRDRLELDPQTGFLTIKNITNTDYGYYKLQIINEKQTTFRRFNVTDVTVTVSDYPEQQENENTPLMNQEKDQDVLVLQSI